MNGNRLVLLPVDGSATAHAAARFATDIASAEGDVLLLLGVAERATLGMMPDPAVTAALHDYLVEIVDEEAAGVRASGATAETLVIDADSIHEAILEVAREREADVIVMGTHGRTGLARTIIGSVADRVLRHSPVPVVLVPLKAED